MAKGGARPGAGQPPTNLRRVLTTRTGPDGADVEVTVMDRIEETIRQGAFVKDAAARVGVAVETLREWQTRGNRIRNALAARDPNGLPRKTLADYTVHDRNCLELAHRMDVAEAEARTALLVIGQQLARGGRDVVETIVKVDAQGRVIDRVTKTTTTAPDPRMIQWLLSHRWRDDFGTRVEVTGAEGGPMQVDGLPIAERLGAELAELARNREASQEAADRLTAAIAGRDTPAPNGSNGHAGNGNGTHS